MGQQHIRGWHEVSRRGSSGGAAGMTLRSGTPDAGGRDAAATGTGLRAAAAVLAVLAALGLALLASRSGPPFATPSPQGTAETIPPAPVRTPPDDEPSRSV